MGVFACFDFGFSQAFALEASFICQALENISLTLAVE